MPSDLFRPRPAAAATARPAASARTQADVQATADALPGPDPDAPEHTTHCGWFDSSHDLRTGLLVQEHADPQSVLADLPLDAWLGLQLASWRPSRLEVRH